MQLILEMITESFKLSPKQSGPAFNPFYAFKFEKKNICESEKTVILKWTAPVLLVSGTIRKVSFMVENCKQTKSR